MPDETSFEKLSLRIQELEHSEQLRRKAEERTNHVNRLLKAIRNVNQLIVQEENLRRLIEKSCVSLSETMGYSGVWIALFDKSGRSIGEFASSGLGAGGKSLYQRLADNSYPACMQKALRSSTPVVVTDPQKQCSGCPVIGDYDNQAGLGHRLEYKGKIYGTITVSIPNTYAHDTEELDLFSELAGDIAFALHKIETTRRLRDSQIRYAQIFEGSRDGYVMVSPEGRILDANQAYCDMLGYSLDELRALPDFYVITPERWHEWEQNEIWEHRLLRLGQSGLYEKEYIRKDGTVFPVELQSYMVRDENGKIDYLWGTARDISGRKQAEGQLRLQSLALNQIADHVTITDLNGVITYINDTTVKSLGRSRDELIGASTEQYGEHPERGARQREIVDETLKNGHWRGEVINYAGDGSEIIMDCRTQVVFNEQGQKIALCGVATDITERKRAEVELNRKSEAIEASKEGIAILDAEGKYVYLNDAHAKIYGYANSRELLGRSWQILYRQDERDRFVDTIIPTLYREGAWSGEAVGKRKDNSLFAQRVSLTALDDGGLICIVQDITEHKRLEKAREEQQALLEAIYRDAPLILMVVDSDRRIQQINGYAAQFANRKVKEMTGMRGGEALRCLHALDSPEGCGFGDYCENCTIRNKVLDTLENKTTHLQVESPFLIETGVEAKELTLSLSTTPITVSGEQMALVTMQDITDAKVAEEERAKLRTQLAQAQKIESIGRLAGGVAHDFNNMLNVILGNVKIVMDDLPSDHHLQHDLNDIYSAAKRSADLTRQLLAFARRQTITPQVLDINDTVASMLTMLKRLIGENIQLIWEPAASVQPTCIDPSQVDQLLANMVVNARDAIGANSGTITIETDNVVYDEEYCADYTDFLPGSYVMLAVSDDGKGMDEETKASIFEPFFTTKGVGSGTGLGLATAYGIIKQNNGFIHVYSEPDEGTTFKIYLPVHMTGQVESKQKTNHTAEVSGGTETVLLVEDEPAMLVLSRKILTRLGYNVLSAATPGEALRLAKEFSGNIDILITDVVMPEMNGRDLARDLMRLYPGLKRLFMSGYTANVIAHQGVLDNGVNFIQKPFSVQDLAAKIREILEQDKK